MQSSVGHFVPGPTYEEMLNPRIPLSDLPDESAPANLFRITWRKPDGGVRCVALPKAVTGVEANILVMVGCYFPSGSHKVGPAYVTLMEGELAGEIQPGVHTLVGPSTGNFGIGVAYIARLKGYPAVVIMPDGMSAERYERIRCYGGRLELTPGSESDVMLVLKRAKEYRNNCNNKVLAQFELLPNYRFHRYVTGQSALEAVTSAPTLEPFRAPASSRGPGGTHEPLLVQKVHLLDHQVDLIRGQKKLRALRRGKPHLVLRGERGSVLRTAAESTR